MMCLTLLHKAYIIDDLFRLFPALNLMASLEDVADAVWGVDVFDDCELRR